MSSSRSAQRRRRHERHGKPSYPTRPRNGFSPTAVIKDEWISQHLDENLPRTIDWGRSYVNADTILNIGESGEVIRKIRNQLFFIIK